MNKKKPVNNLYMSDFHFNHYDYEKQKGIITFERTQFKTIEEHDQCLINTLQIIANKYGEGSTLWFLGDFGDLSYLYVFNFFKEKGININFMLGNHDHQEDIPYIQKFVDKIYEYPVYISQKIVLSHFPVAVYSDQCNIHGHLHGAKLQDINHLNASLHVANYRPITDNNVAAVFAKLPKFNRHFLWEPWAADYQFVQEKEDAVFNRDGVIDLPTSKMIQYLKAQQRKQENNFYQPYHGGFSCGCSKEKQEGK